MVALAAFVIEADNPLPVHDIGKAVFQAMRGGWNRIGNPPDDHFDDVPIVGYIAESVDQFGLHVGEYVNIGRACQLPRLRGCQTGTLPTSIDFIDDPGQSR